MWLIRSRAVHHSIRCQAQPWSEHLVELTARGLHLILYVTSLLAVEDGPYIYESFRDGPIWKSINGKLSRSTVCNASRTFLATSSNHVYNSIQCLKIPENAGIAGAFGWTPLTSRGPFTAPPLASIGPVRVRKATLLMSYYYSFRNCVRKVSFKRNIHLPPATASPLLLLSTRYLQTAAELAEGLVFKT